MHKRKHDMILSLNKTNPCASDETPTPTRFIRNCEAIGLFQDLQNVNPFEETFRQATEAVKKGQCLKVPTVPSLGKPAGEDLHTPHIYLKDDGHSSDGKVCEYEIEKVAQSEISIPTKTPFSAPPCTTTMIKENKIDYKSANDDVHLFVKMANGALVQITSLNNFEILKSGVLTNGSINLATPVVQNINYTQVEPSPEPLPSINSSAAVDSAAVKKKLKEALLKTPKQKIISNPEHYIVQDSKVDHQSRKEKQVPLTVPEDPETDRKRKSLERNRIAAMKCREKRKKWVADLREKYEKMCYTNQALVKEVVFLRKEVARLKGLLISRPQICLEDISPSTTTVNLISPSSSPKRPSSSPDLNTAGITSSLKGPREGLRLDIEGASRNAVMDLDSPLVRKDEILSSVAPPTTPNERLISFTELDRDTEVVEVAEERAATTVIQINPNALAKSSLVFS
ncbi:cyclic AMP-dependent transcription factor ATF-7 isoform X3 [Halyomorpha halys]|nr:cyclic AMP-dependent transcription factor ATF-7 isoform X2 [Halyomorpha halys]XP_024214526.1 cyclic AMP-dependent transcription factor ATF-7 isoform X2 [Halyomorpha halys]